MDCVGRQGGALSPSFMGQVSGKHGLSLSHPKVSNGARGRRLFVIAIA